MAAGVSGRAETILLVRAGGRPLGLVIGDVREVVALGPSLPVPVVDPALRGVVRLRARLVPLLHLAAFLDRTPCPTVAGEVGVLAGSAERPVCLEVDEADRVVRERLFPVPRDAALAWASGVVRREGRIIPVLDTRALGARLSEVTTR